MYIFINVHQCKYIKNTPMHIKIGYFSPDIKQDFLKSEWNKNIIYLDFKS